MNRTPSRFLALLLGSPARQGRADDGDQGSGIRNRIVETTALVEAVDQKQQLVTLKCEDTGMVATIKADDSVKNLKQVKKGDRVRIQYNEALVWNPINRKARMTPDASSSGQVVSSESGEMPRRGGDAHGSSPRGHRADRQEGALGDAESPQWKFRDLRGPGPRQDRRPGGGHLYRILRDLGREGAEEMSALCG